MIKELHQKLVNGETTSVKLTEEYFDRIKKDDESIGAYLTLTEDLALRQADLIDKKIKQGEKIDLIAGIPGAIKDNICVAGTRTTAASKILDNYIAPYNATVAERLLKEGAVFLGKTNMDEFACGSSTEKSAYRPTKNPLDPERVPGGSSGGSAAAIAADLAVWSLGSDTGGSIRQPAAYTGTVGLKPTYGRVSRYGLLAMASSLDQIGPIVKTVEDAAIVLSRIAGEDSMDATSARSGGKFYEDYLNGNLAGAKIGVPREYVGEELDSEVKMVFEQSLKKFEKAGAEIREVNIPLTPYALAVYYILMTSELSSNLARFDGIKYGLSIDDEQRSADNSGTLLEIYLDSRRYGFGEEIKRRIILGTYALSAGYYDAYYKKAQKVRRMLREDFEKVFNEKDGVDFIFSPTTPEPAFKFGEKSKDPLAMYLADIYTVSANLVGVPAISFPIGMVKREGKDLPLGGQLMGKWFDEENLLNAAYAFEQLE